MRYIRYAILAAIGICLVAVALANRGLVTIKLLPEGLAGYVGVHQSMELPLFVVIFGSIIVGILLGFVWEWMREHKHRAEVIRKTGEVARLERELRRAKGAGNKGQDDVLALLDDPA